MTDEEKIAKQGWFLWDNISQDIVLERDATKPCWAYTEIYNTAENDDIITEHYQLGGLLISFSYSVNTPVIDIEKNRQAHFKRHNVDNYQWALKYICMPNKEFEKYLKQYL